MTTQIERAPAAIYEQFVQQLETLEGRHCDVLIALNQAIVSPPEDTVIRKSNFHIGAYATNRPTARLTFMKQSVARLTNSGRVSPVPKDDQLPLSVLETWVSEYQRQLFVVISKRIGQNPVKKFLEDLAALIDTTEQNGVSPTTLMQFIDAEQKAGKTYFGPLVGVPTS